MGSNLSKKNNKNECQKKCSHDTHIINKKNEIKIENYDNENTNDKNDKNDNDDNNEENIEIVSKPINIKK